MHDVVAGAFDLAPGAELSIEIHPPVTSDEQMETLASLGFNRVSMGVQDFDLAVQQARQTAAEPTANARDHDRSIVPGLRQLRPRFGDRDARQRNTLRRLASPRRSISEMV